MTMQDSRGRDEQGRDPEGGTAVAGADQGPGALERVANRSASWMEKWFPDAFVIALLGIVIVSAGALAIGASPVSTAEAFGDGFWNLIPFAMQMGLIVVGGYVLASAPPVLRLIDKLAQHPSTERGTVAFVAFCVVCASLLNWGFALVFASLLVRALARRSDLHFDYRAASAAAFLGTGATNMLGISSSVALLHATPSSVPEELYRISGYIPLTSTIFLWQSGVLILVMASTGIAVAYFTAPTGERIRTAADLGVDVSDEVEEKTRTRPGEFLEHSPVLTIVIGALMVTWLVLEVLDIGAFDAISNLNSYNFLVLTLALLLHWRPYRFVQAFTKATPTISGVLLQFPLYAGIAGILVGATNASGNSLSHYLSEAFAALGGGIGLPIVVGVYSIVMGVFIPSAGAKWVLEAPYIFDAATQTGTNFGWLIQTYSATESLANFLNPFWMLPLLGIVGLKARNIVGFTTIYFIVLAPITLVAIWLLSLTLGYEPPVFP